VARAELISSISTYELLPLLDDAERPYMLDVRETDEVADWKIAGVHNIPLDALEKRVEEVPRDERLVVICAAGTRARQGAEILARHDMASEVLEGGMGAWASTYDQVEGTFGGATVVQLRRRGKGCLSYVIGGTTSAVVIDPSREIVQYLDVAACHGWTISHVLDTHLHADHISGARQLVTESGAALWLNPADPFQFEFEPLVDGKSIELKPGVDLRVSSVSVPGHTEGSTMYQLGEEAIFTGDTLFLESVGRPDLADQAEAFAHHLYASLHQRVLPLSDEITVFPAHFGPSVTVHAREFVARKLGSLRYELAVLALDEDDFVAWALANVKDRPGNYKQIASINTGQVDLGADGVDLEMGPNRCAVA
jgi:glyoxylase-like metal-dependent hydrolase (beta-lactamase superfamily II)